MKSEIASTSSTGNVFADIELPDVEVLYAKMQLSAAISKAIKEKGVSQAELAELAGMKQPRISLMCNHRTKQVSLEAMLKVLAALGYDVSITPKPRLDPVTTYKDSPVDEADQKLAKVVHKKSRNPTKARSSLHPKRKKELHK